ncbi:MAG: hypothetical protein AAF763_15450 [Pseudomonadota bacterium]
MSSDRASLRLRLLLIAAAGVVGVAAGGIVGALAAQGADGLVGGAKVMLGAMIGGGAGLIVGALAGWKLSARPAKAAAWALGAPAVVLLALAARGLWQIDQETRDPEEAYAGLPVFIAALERDPAADPYLAPRVEVDANARTWTTAMPDGGACRGRLRAEVQRRLTEGLPQGPAPDACRDAPPAGDLVRLTWWIDGGPEGAALMDPACRAAAPRLATLERLLPQASSMMNSAPSCD